MSEEEMFINPRILVGRDVKDDISVVSCTWCGAVVADVAIHHTFHTGLLTLASVKPTNGKTK